MTKEKLKMKTFIKLIYPGDSIFSVQIKENNETYQRIVEIIKDYGLSDRLSIVGAVSESSKECAGFSLRIRENQTWKDVSTDRILTFYFNDREEKMEIYNLDENSLIKIGVYQDIRG